MTKTKRPVTKAILIAAFLLTLGFLFGRPAVSEAAEKPYMIKVNKQKNCVTVYEKDEKGKYTVPVKAMICSGGSDTPVGTFNTLNKYRWQLMVEDVWSQYATRITGSILFHSVWYYYRDPSTLSARQYNNLGKTVSHGCIRLTCEDAKWIYDNCPLGTKVIIYNSSIDGPLGRPEAIKLPLSTGWDPTDTTNKSNPWNDKKPTISGAKNTTVKYGAKVDLKKGVTAKSTTGFGITSDIKVKGKVDTKSPGKYKITYSVTDLLGRTAKKTVTWTVEDNRYIPVISGVGAKAYIDGDTELTKDVALEGVTATIDGKKVAASKIKVTIKEKKEDIYTVTYSVTGPKGQVTKKTSTFYIDREAPELFGVMDLYMGSKELKQYLKDGNLEEFMMEGITAEDNLSKMSPARIFPEWSYEADDIILCTYTVSDDAGNTTEATCRIYLDGAEERADADKSPEEQPGGKEKQPES
ncbi:L,D-transpeptidase family protein [Anaerolentibacter hominis]|uniref:L,D-transpeptidase family protein n=1 Tax=Anaerolentibacter hominis TaxID=3079009 RepID=UPI0031B82BD6